MKRLLALVLLLAALCTPAFAADDILTQEAEILGADSLTDALDGEMQKYLPDIGKASSDSFSSSLWQIVTDTISSLGGYWRGTLKTAASLLAVTALCAVLASFESGRLAPVCTLGGALALTLICAGSLDAMIGLATDTLQKIADFSALLLPVLCSACAASGALTSAGALYAGSSLFMSVLTKAVAGLCVPLVYAYVALAAAECMAPHSGLEKLRELVGWVIQTVMKAVVTLFTAYLAITGIFSGSADTMTLKAAKAALSGALPVVGGIVSDATGSVLASAAAIRNGAGMLGMLAALAMGLLPFARIGLQYLSLKLCAALGGMLGTQEHVRLLGALSSAMGYMLAMTGSAMLMTLISCCCFMKVVN